MHENLDTDIKLSKHYDGDKLRSAVMNMEQFYALSQDEKLSNKDAICAYKLFEHYRRLAMCILMKEFDLSRFAKATITVDYMHSILKPIIKENKHG